MATACAGCASATRATLARTARWSPPASSGTTPVSECSRSRYLPYISPIFPLYLPYISPILPLSLTGNGSWSDRGCVQAAAPTRRSDGFVHCQCNHLTDFGGVMLPRTPEELLAEF